MNIEDRIYKAEEQFFLDEVRSATFLIMSFNAFAELMESLGGDPTLGKSSYEGLIISITEHPSITDFVLA